MNKTFNVIPEHAEIVRGAVAIKSFNDEHGILTVDVPNGYDDIKRISKHVLRYGDNLYMFTGWNSDTNEAYFKFDGARVATIVRNR